MKTNNAELDVGYKQSHGTVCLTFDNMGHAKAHGEGTVPSECPSDVSLGYPRILRLLAELQLQASFFVEGWSAEQYSTLVLSMAEHGHDVGVHGYAHEKLGKLGPVEVEQIIRRATASFNALGLTPSGFRAPGGLASPYSSSVLRELGYVYESSCDHDYASAELMPQNALGDVPVGGGRDELVSIPWRWQSIDLYHYRVRQPALSPDALEAHLAKMMDEVAAERKNLTVIFHPYVSGVDEQKYRALCRILRRLASHTDLRVVTALDLANRQLHTKSLKAREAQR